MEEIQRFTLANVYCAPSQDRSFTFKSVRVTKQDYPVKRTVTMYNVVKPLPDLTSFFHVYVIGNIPPSHLNLLRQNREWLRDSWINVNEDMENRNYVLQFYNDDGVMIPRSLIYYSFIDESSLVFAVRITDDLRRNFQINTYKYFRVYSNSYFNSDEFANLPVRYGIRCETALVVNNVDKVQIQNRINQLKAAGGDVIIYVNGYYTDNMNLNIPDNAFVEFVYDQSIISKEKFVLGTLRTFDSIKDNTLKYLIHRPKLTDTIQYHDDNDIYVSTDDSNLVTKGLYYYRHSDTAMRNVTDKDYSVKSSFLNTQADRLSVLTEGAIQDKVVVLYTRKSGMSRTLIYSALKLHELYKLPMDVQLDVLLGSNHSIPAFRAETLENSQYFRLAAKRCIKEITKEMSTITVGYAGVIYYYGQSVIEVDNGSIDVPFLFRRPSYAYEYDNQGKYVGRYATSGPLYIPSVDETKYVEFLKGVTPGYFEKLYVNGETVPVDPEFEFRVITAYFSGVSRVSNWEDITNTITVSNNQFVVSIDPNKKAKIVYLDEPLTYDLELPFVDGVLFFPLQISEDRGTGIQEFPVDTHFQNLEVYLNGYRLTYRLDFSYEMPYINIYNKKFIDYTKTNQSIHIRMHGFSVSKDDLNAHEISGYVNNGVLTRNNFYDIRDDRVFSVFIDGKMYKRSLVRFAEEDNTVRVNDALNGLPYSLTEHFVAIEEVTGMPTYPDYITNNALNDSIRGLFNQIFPEPPLSPFQVIQDHIYLFSPVVAKIIHDMLDGNISPTLYTTPYNDSTIHNLLDNQYETLMRLDPVKLALPDSLVEIHPHSGNSTIQVNLHMYRFITNVIRVITLGHPERINISGYLTVTTTNDPNAPLNPNTPGGVITI